jgi:kynureninase
LHGFDPATALIEVAPRTGEATLREEDLHAYIERNGAEIATVLLPGVNYLSGQRFDLRAAAAAARRAGCTIGFDLAHAIGNVPLELHESGADFAIWCSYKYLNGGPGAVGGAFVHDRHAHSFQLPRLAGWWGHDKRTRFDMPDAFVPLAGAEGWQLSNPPILAMAPLNVALEQFERATLAKLRTKSEQLTAYVIRALMQKRPDRIRVITPTHAEARGSQLSLILDVDTVRAKRLRQQLHAAGIVCDWREPNIVRVAPTPLYNTFHDAWKLVSVLEEITA